MIEQLQNQPGFPLTRECFERSPFVIGLETGGKTLKVKFFLDRGAISTDVRRQYDQVQVPGATTLLYGRAFQLMQEAATVIGQPLLYTATTAHPSMREWILDATRGQEIFDWDEIVTYQGVVNIEAKKLIYPGL